MTIILGSDTDLIIIKSVGSDFRCLGYCSPLETVFAGTTRHIKLIKIINQKNYVCPCVCACVSVYVCMDIQDLISTSVYNYKREKNENLKIFMTCIYITKLFTKKLEFNVVP